MGCRCFHFEKGQSAGHSGAPHATAVEIAVGGAGLLSGLHTMVAVRVGS